MPDLDKIIPIAGQTAGNAVAAIKQVQGRLSRIRELRDRRAELGGIFVAAYELPQHIYRWSLISCAMVGLITLIGGVLNALQSSHFLSLQVLFTNYWLLIVGIGLLSLGVTAGEALSWLALAITALIPSMRHSIDRFNVRQFCNFLEKPKPLALGSIGIDALADLAIVRLIAQKVDDLQFASKPVGLTESERSNVALFGCLLEQEHYVRRWQLRNWRDFYSSLAAAEHGDGSVFSQTAIKSIRAQGRDYYQALRQAVDPHLQRVQQPPLEDSGVVAQDVMRMVDVLIAMYDGSARNLAKVSERGFDIRLAFERAAEFPHFSGQSIRPQFLKLAVRWDVWPGIRVGNFIYPFSSSLAAFLLDREALITAPDVKEVGFKSSDEQLVVREAMRRIVERVEELLRSVDRPEYQHYYRALETSELHPLEWEVAQHVDFVLWAESYSLAKENRFTNWTVPPNKVVTRRN